MGIERTTFVIDKEGKIAKIYPRVKVDQHADLVLAFVRDCSRGAFMPQGVQAGHPQERKTDQSGNDWPSHSELAPYDI